MANIINSDKVYKEFGVKTGENTSEFFEIGADAKNVFIQNAEHTQYGDADGVVDLQTKLDNFNKSVRNIGSGVAAEAYSTAFGQLTQANGQSSHAEGYETLAQGDFSHAEGYHTSATGKISHAEGYYTSAAGYASHAEGYQNKIDIEAQASHVEGEKNIAYGYWSHVEGYDNQHIVDHRRANTHQDASHIEGRHHRVSVLGIHVEGEGHDIRSEGWHDEVGYVPLQVTTSKCEYRTEEVTTEVGVFAYQMVVPISALSYDWSRNGAWNSDDYIYARGVLVGRGMSTDNVTAFLVKDEEIDYFIFYSNEPFDEKALYYPGFDFTAVYRNNNLPISMNGSHIQGKYSNIDSPYAHIVGNGLSSSQRSNAHTLDWDGNAMFAGDIQFKYNNTIQSLANIIKNLQSQIDELKQ